MPDDEMGSAPDEGLSADEGTSPEGSGSAAASDAEGLGGSSDADVASAGSGGTPGSGDDAKASDGAGQAEGAVAPVASPVPAGPYRFANREFPSQEKAEEYFRSQVGRVPDLQRRVAQMEQLEQQYSELQRNLAVLQSRGLAQGGNGAVSQQSAQAQAQTFQDQLVQSGDLKFIAEMAQEDLENGKGLGRAFYAMAEKFGERLQTEMQRFESERFTPMQQQQEFQQAMTGVAAAVNSLKSEFPELDDENKSPEAAEARTAILETFKSFPPEQSIRNPREVLAYAAWKYRQTHGIPVFAQPPGTSTSPSALAAQAAEAAQPAGMVLEGTGVPPQRPNGVPETPQESLARDIARADERRLKGKDGFDLGVSSI